MTALFTAKPNHKYLRPSMKKEQSPSVKQDALELIFFSENRPMLFFSEKVERYGN